MDEAVIITSINDAVEETTSLASTPTTTPIANNPHGSNNVARCLTPVVQNKDQLLALIGPYPYEAPDGFKWVPNGWKLEKQVKPSTRIFASINVHVYSLYV